MQSGGMEIFTMKKFLSILLAAILVFALCACTQAGPAEKTAAETEASDWDYVSAKGKLVIGYTDYAPMNYLDENGTLVGFDTEFAKAVCEKLGIEPEFVEINWDTKEVELNAKNIDCIWNGFTINAEREANLDFTKPYIKNKQVVVIKKDNTELYKDTASLADANLVAESASAGADAIAADENLSKASFVEVSKQTDALLEVKSGTADAAVLDYTLAYAMVGEGTDYEDLMMIDKIELGVEEYGIGFRTGSDMVEKVNAVIDELIADGTMNAIAEKYDLSAIVLK